jgi:hypothetical protein
MSFVKAHPLFWRAKSLCSSMVFSLFFFGTLLHGFGRRNHQIVGIRLQIIFLRFCSVLKNTIAINSHHEPSSEVVLQITGLPMDVLRLIWDQVGDREIFLVGLSSKTWMDVISIFRMAREEYIAGNSRLHPTLFPDHSYTSRKKLSILEEALNNLEEGKYRSVTISGNSTGSNLLGVTGMSSVEGGNLICMEHDIYNEPLEDGEEEQPASCCAMTVDLSRYPRVTSSLGYCVETVECFPCGRTKYVQIPQYAGKSPILLRETAPAAERQKYKWLSSLPKLFPDFGQVRKHIVFNSSADYPLVVIKPSRHDSVQIMRAANVLTEEVLFEEVKITEKSEVVSFNGPWILLNNPHTLINVYSGERLSLPEAWSDRSYMADARRIVAFQSTNGELRYADLSDGMPMEDIESQLQRNKFTAAGVSGRLALVAGRLAVFISGGDKLLFVDVSAVGANLISTISWPLGDVDSIRTVDHTLFAIQRGELGVDLLDLLCREPRK